MKNSIKFYLFLALAAIFNISFLDKNDGSSIRLCYLNGAQPAGFIEPWTADFLKIE